MFVQIIYEKEFDIEKVSHENYFFLFSVWQKVNLMGFTFAVYVCKNA